MPSNVYEILALTLRYWFVLLGVVIVLRSFSWLRHDRKEKHRRLRELPDAGTVGAFFVLQEAGDLQAEMSLPVTWEGILGASRQCDICLPVAGVAGRHADYEFRSGTGLILIPRRRQSLRIDGETIGSRRDAMDHPMQHGSVVEIGEARLVFRAFKGVGAERRSALADADTPADTAASVPANTTDDGRITAAAVDQTGPAWDTWFVDTDPHPDYTVPVVGEAMTGSGPSGPAPADGRFIPTAYTDAVPDPHADMPAPEVQPAVNPYARPSAASRYVSGENPYARPVAPADAALSAYRHRRQMRKEAPNGQDEA